MTDGVLAIVAPGQGAQKPGMLAPWLELDGVDALLAEFSQSTELNLTQLGTEADAEEIKDTAVTQPLVVATALIAATQLEIPASAVAAGHSVGELAAAAIAGVLDAATATALAARRGRAMAAACMLSPSSMAACMNPDTERVLELLAERDLVGANVNGGGQIVAAGAADAIALLAADPPDGIRVIQLPVAGAFHTHFMQPAQAELTPIVGRLAPGRPVRPLLTNSDGSVVDDGARYVELLLAQITSPVRWDLCMKTFAELGVTGVLELPPAGTLVGLAKRELKGVATLACKTPDDLDAAAAFIAQHGGAA
ncbi:ACP S-malonyltransferase [Nakamurella sp. A5-74]|uniref:[acyl-carrier-protein] S-malonyltransferase n=1 Tax=Nakamurella sp. A5-74 TaxID=3158264 RepID=A0AAU8DVU3_9ACTN